MKKIILGLIVAFAAFSCDGHIDQRDPTYNPNPLTLTATPKSYKPTDTNGTVFTVNYTKGGKETDVTAEATCEIYRKKMTGEKEDVKIEGAKFLTSTEGEYEFYAVYTPSEGAKQEKTTTIKVSVTNEKPLEGVVKGAPFKKIAMFDFTGIRCPNCHVTIGQMMELKSNYTSRIVGVEFHDPTNYSKGTGYESKYTTSYVSRFGISGYPAVLAEYSPLLQAPTTYDGLEKAVKKSAESNPATVAIKIESVLKDAKTVEIKVSLLPTVSATYYLAVLIVEDGLYGKQTGAPDPSYDTHNGVVRDYVGIDAMRDESLGKLTAGKEFTKTLTYETNKITDNSDDPAKWNKNNCRVIVMVSKPGGSVLGFKINNTAYCALDGGSIDYKYEE